MLNYTLVQYALYIKLYIYDNTTSILVSWYRTVGGFLVTIIFNIKFRFSKDFNMMIKKISKFHFKSQSGMNMAKMHQLKLFLCSFYRPSLQDQRISLPQWRLYSCSLCLWHRKRLPRRFGWDWLSVRWETMDPIEWD